MIQRRIKPEISFLEVGLFSSHEEFTFNKNTYESYLE